MKYTRMKLILFLTFGFFPSAVKAQFYTITTDTAKVQILSGYHEKDYNYIRHSEEKVSTSRSKEAYNYFSQPKGREIRIEKSIPVFVNTTDSLLMGLLKDRMNVCLPLDYLKLNSSFGIRKDPVEKCKRFHDGIDLQCNNEYVYSMLPGVVKKVHFGNRGYGNYIILDYGNLQSLYGHLSTITVKEGEHVIAGSIVGVSGNTGKSTGPHLHLALMKNWKSVDPQPFIAYLNHYIIGLQDKIAYLKFGKRPPLELTISNLYEVLEKHKVSNKIIVIAQAILETGYFTSRVCLEQNNLFGLRRPSTGDYYGFKNWEESVKAYRDYVQYKYKGGDYFAFLDRIGYAEDKAYIEKLRSIVNALRQ